MTQTIKVDNTTVYIDGTTGPALVMLHGWPDTHSLWSAQVQFFRDQYRCVRFTMPGFSREDRRSYSVDAMCTRIGRIVDAVSPTEPVILLLHDWGCVFGYEYAMRNPARVARLIGIDVGDARSKEFLRQTSVQAKLMIVSYQMTLAAAWRLGGAAGDRITRAMASALGAKAPSVDIHSGMNYAYAMQWLGEAGGFKGLQAVDPGMPFFYAYGTRKPVMFQTEGWLRAQAAKPGNAVKAYDSGHWVMQARADAFNADLRHWLDSKA